jgi:hypothetical protein
MTPPPTVAVVGRKHDGKTPVVVRLVGAVAAPPAHGVTNSRPG